MRKVVKSLVVLFGVLALIGLLGMQLTELDEGANPYSFLLWSLSDLWYFLVNLPFLGGIIFLIICWRLFQLVSIWYEN